MDVPTHIYTSAAQIALTHDKNPFVRPTPVDLEESLSDVGAIEMYVRLDRPMAIYVWVLVVCLAASG